MENINDDMDLGTEQHTKNDMEDEDKEFNVPEYEIAKRVETNEERKKRLERDEEEYQKLIKERKDKNAQPVSEKNVNRIGEYFKNKVATKEETKQAEEEMGRMYKILDEESGEIVKADLTKKSDRHALTEQNKIALYYPHDHKIWNEEKKCPSSHSMFEYEPGVWEFDPKKDLKNILPIGHLIPSLLERDAKFYDEYITWLPIYPIPVKTSGLFYMITGYPNPQYIDSLTVMKVYMSTIKLLSDQGFINSTIMISCAWIKTLLTHDDLKLEELQEWVNNIELYDEKKVEEIEKAIQKLTITKGSLNDPQKRTKPKKKMIVVKKNQKEEDKDDMLIGPSEQDDNDNNNEQLKKEARDKLQQLLVEERRQEQTFTRVQDLILLFKEGKLKGWMINERFRTQIKVIHIYENAKKSRGWAATKLNILFKEEVTNELETFKEGLVDKFSQQAVDLTTKEGDDELENWTKERAQSMITYLGQFTIELLKGYEIAIMRLLTKPCINPIWEQKTTGGIKGFPLKELGRRFCTDNKIPLISDLIAREVLIAINEERTKFTRLRNSVFLKMANMSRTDANNPTVVHQNLLGTQFELYSLFRFLRFNPDSEEEVQKMLDPKTKRVTVKDLELAKNPNSRMLEQAQHIEQLVSNIEQLKIEEAKKENIKERRDGKKVNGKSNNLPKSKTTHKQASKKKKNTPQKHTNLFDD